MNRLLLITLSIIFLTIGGVDSRLHAQPKPDAKSPIKSDEQVIFYPTRGWRVDETPNADWEIDLHGCIFEPGKRADGLKLLRELTDIDIEKLTPEELKIFGQRAELFAVDHERGKAIPVWIGDRVVTLSESEANGHFYGRIRLPDAEVNAASGGKFSELTVTAILRPDDSRTMMGTVHLVPRSPVVHIVSDIDDTIKISQVRDKSELLWNTFCRPFRPAPGMAELYRGWAADDGRFHYMSASPWQLYTPLAAFISEHKFPAGSFQMKHFRLQDRTVLNLFGSQEEYKRSVIEPLLKQFPQDRFVLVGDTGEQDPSIYAGLARDYPQVSRIFIRNVTQQSTDAFRETFQGLPADRWQIFLDPSEIKVLLKDLR